MFTEMKSGHKTVAVVGLHIAALLLALPGWAGEPVDRKQELVTISAIGTMTAIGHTYFQYSDARKLLEVVDTPIWKGAKPRTPTRAELASLISTGTVKDTDTVVVKYLLTEAESRAAEIERLNSEGRSLKTQANELLNKVEFEQRVHGENANFERLSSMGDEAAKLELRAEAALAKAERLQKGEALERVIRVAEIDLNKGRIADVDTFLRDRMVAGNHIESIYRRPKDLALQISKMRRSGMLGIGGFVVAGVVTGIALDSQRNVSVFQPVLITIDRAMKN